MQSAAIRKATGVALLVLGLAVAGASQAAKPEATEARLAAGHAQQPAPEARDGRGAYRFHMQQEGRKMSAEEFDAWMKSNGIRVAKGKPAAGGGDGAGLANAAKDK